MFSDTKIKRYHRKEQGSVLRLPDRDGLHLRVSKKGKVVFYIRYRFAGKAQEMDIGNYPAMTLKVARDKNIHYRGLIQEGVNPKTDKALSLNGDKQGISFFELTRMWYEKDAEKRLKNHIQARDDINNHIMHIVGSFPAGDIKTHKWLDILEVITEKTPFTAHSILVLVRGIYSFGIRRRLLTDNPLLNITSKRDLGVNANVRERFLNNNEIKLLYFYIDNSKRIGCYKNALMLKLALYFGCRASELRLAKKTDFDFKKMIWTVPAENHKMGFKTKKPILRPIIKEFEGDIKGLMQLSSSEYLLTSSSTGSKHERVFWTTWPKRINLMLQRHGKDPIDSWSVHDLRKTIRTNMSSLAPPHVAEIMLGHTLGRVWGAYDKHDYIEEQRAAYKAWWDRLQFIVYGESNDNVIQFRVNE